MDLLGYVRTAARPSWTGGLLDAETRAKAAMVPGFAFFKCDAGYSEESQPDHLGENRWTEEQLYEARGGYMLFRYEDLIQTLYAAATGDPPTSASPSRGTVSIRFGAEVVDVDVTSDACAVTLLSGEIHRANAIIGADGTKGVVRRTLLEVEGGADVPMGIAVYCSILPKSLVFENGLEWFYEDLGSSIWMGANRGAWIFPVGGTSDLALWVFTQDDMHDGTWTEADSTMRLVDILGQCDTRLHRLAALAGPPTCIQITNPHRLESWVSKSGRVLALGDAAHPTVPGGIHTFSIALEDAAFIGRIFWHTHNKERVPEFLHAFQEHRRVSNNQSTFDELTQTCQGSAMLSHPRK
ncbi:FAD-binding-3 domain-containing protein [Mycena sanguinolenta]|uniref:FAD-binding-3 domain-containing protein n=1 Tax=Mycena sanguinolenta TaxID=230812 RepID=A0A8H6Z992_9AGAR|nr:FAD-binding-3 domain-containing protein [Mycena sanguinolenta]